jgi:hypothetical protein
MAAQYEQGRADRLLAKMHRVLSHDLPNQIVALQSLVQLLEMEQADRLTDDGRDCLERVQRVARKTSGLARFLRELARLNTGSPRVVPVVLGALEREIRLELHQQIPTGTMQCCVTGDSEPFPAEPRRLVLAIVEIVRGLANGDAPAGTLMLTGRSVGAARELHGELIWVAGPITESAASRPSPNERLGIILAGEILASFGARLTDIREDRDRSRFTILCSTPTGHV